MYEVIATGSTGNAVFYLNTILVDCGVPYSRIKPYQQDIQLVLLTHKHGDHFNRAALKKLASERPAMRIGCGEWMYEDVKDFRNVDVYEAGKVYDYGTFEIVPVKLYHDIPNFGYRIFKDELAILHATDTAHLEGISAEDYDLYAIEHNYNEDTIEEIIAARVAAGEYVYQRRSINYHLSEQKAADFIYRNRGNKSHVLRLHESSTNL